MPLRPVPQGPAAEVTQPPTEVQRGNPTVFQRWEPVPIKGGPRLIFFMPELSLIILIMPEPGFSLTI